MDLADQVRATIQRYNLFEKGELVLMAVSGGPDSIALASVLNQLRHEMGLRLHIAHLDHKLREDSAQDAEFVRQFADSVNIPCAIEARTIQTKRKGSLEDAARAARYEFLVTTAKKIKASCIAVGHHQNDLAETVLMRILRGTGLKGLRGILPKREFKGIKIVRPLLETQRTIIEEYLTKTRTEFRRDPTNNDNRFLRNKVRNELIPHLKQEYNPRVNYVLANLGRMIQDDYALLEEFITELSSEVITRRSKTHLELDAIKFGKLPRAAQRMLLRSVGQYLIGESGPLDFVHILHLEEALASPKKETRLDLPHNISFQKDKNRIIFRRGRPKTRRGRRRHP